ncbi:HBL/NHE enterotoxin family protein [Bacillus thuringiensis]|uniref:HBL/NHE enterotoxin family protein n=1 Tax=Bacillus thuringiensis TaxID=1428 RepID=UPI0005AEF67D|nr:HBL/NHE enterotoxin family protein [Bacillus thuringiensis]KIP23146.1 hemolytic enterotoxin family protein [Bacillus thuringiensis serovar morrisoni]MCT6948010.1 alpha-helical pore-forming toxin family protein [Bacillus thuringiensis]MED2079894.1 HBL/NHE enterotoxin family protein [Bacillus thuringiensis]NUW50734.1 HBL/NHE enterotoxin family protein [Bacillus thuringiensis]HDR6822744.1 HBL/NHE enterotoxin family protein [Bacillus thuringiensis]
MKKLIIGTLATSIIANNVAIPQIFADGHSSIQQNNLAEDAQKKFQQQSTPYASLGTQVKLMEVSALMLAKQPTIKVDSVPTYIDHQQKMKEHANDWLDSYNRQLLESIESIINFDRAFSTYYQTLSKAAKDINNDESKRKFLQGLSLIQKKMNTVHHSFNSTTTNINNFQYVIKEDVNNFKTDAEKIEEILVTNDKSIKDLTSQVQSINDAINKDIIQIIGSSAAIVGGTVQIIIGGIVVGGDPKLAGALPIVSGIITIGGGITGVAIASKDFDKQNKLLVDVTQNLSDAKALAINLALAKERTSNFVESVSNEQAAFEKINTEWKMFNDSINDLSENVKNKEYLDPMLLQQKLDEIKVASSTLGTQATEFNRFILESKVE